MVKLGRNGSGDSCDRRALPSYLWAFTHSETAMGGHPEL